MLFHKEYHITRHSRKKKVDARGKSAELFEMFRVVGFIDHEPDTSKEMEVSKLYNVVRGFGDVL